MEERRSSTCGLLEVRIESVCMNRHEQLVVQDTSMVFIDGLLADVATPTCVSAVATPTGVVAVHLPTCVAAIATPTCVSAVATPTGVVAVYCKSHYF